MNDLETKIVKWGILLSPWWVISRETNLVGAEYEISVVVVVVVVVVVFGRTAPTQDVNHEQAKWSSD